MQAIKKPGRLAPTRTKRKITLTPLYTPRGGMSRWATEGYIMAYMCVRVPHKECDCCMECTLDRLGYATDIPERFPGDADGLRCEECGCSVMDDGYYYEIDGDALCNECVDRRYRKEVPNVSAREGK